MKKYGIIEAVEPKRKHKKFWIIVVVVAAVALILTSFLPYILLLQQ